MRHGCLLPATVVAVTLLAPVGAHAADEIGISRDGTSWSSNLDEPLFDPGLRWVPGDTRTSSFFVRNQGPSGSAITIEVRSLDSDELLADDDIHLRARAAEGAWVDLRNEVTSTLLTEKTIEQGAAVRVDVNATFDEASTNQSQVGRLAIAFRVRLADAAAGEPGDDLDGASPSAGDTVGDLPDTGSATPRWIVLGGLGLALVGVLLASRLRVDREVWS
ncbi:LPXTG cell wall anchor domain-containing protein [Aeromicrobium sp. Leaf291]|uniref:LPXTG cell wall anchor domain-containing protein n=1 Tax=Aeromicrobium sp. Leaf291 TaxID=1736325 RepID=UPI000A3E62E8|nr:LPXTG cell wall anchor domain-containing protein [Aeromicrobium sp. Leaf291]